jgi:hypothetical protein
MTRRRLFLLVILAAATVAGYFLSRPPPRPATPATPSAQNRTAVPSPSRPAKAQPEPGAGPDPRSATPEPAPVPAFSVPFNPADFPIAAALNAADSDIRRDLGILQQLFDAWRTNFPREGNPVGENADITAALTGRNPLGLALVPRNHPALNPQGELCDRWGTPFRFHQLSGERMEVRSAGPDRRFATDDDAILTPP